MPWVTGDLAATQVADNLPRGELRGRSRKREPLGGGI